MRREIQVGSSSTAPGASVRAWFRQAKNWAIAIGTIAAIGAVAVATVVAGVVLAGVVLLAIVALVLGVWISQVFRTPKQRP